MGKIMIRYKSDNVTWKTCETCGGEGEADYDRETWNGPRQHWKTCETCGGSGEIPIDE